MHGRAAVDPIDVLENFARSQHYNPERLITNNKGKGFKYSINRGHNEPPIEVMVKRHKNWIVYFTKILKIPENLEEVNNSSEFLRSLLRLLHVYQHLLEQNADLDELLHYAIEDGHLCKRTNAPVMDDDEDNIEFFVIVNGEIQFSIKTLPFELKSILEKVESDWKRIEAINTSQNLDG